MKNISIKELHATTGKFVRDTRNRNFIITDRGKKVDVLRTCSAEEVMGEAFPRRDLRTMPKVSTDLSDYISDDREFR